MKKAEYPIGAWVEFTHNGCAAKGVWWPLAVRGRGQVIGATYRRPGRSVWDGDFHVFVPSGPAVFVLQVRTSYMGKPIDILPEHATRCSAPEGGLPYHANAKRISDGMRRDLQLCAEEMVRDDRGRFVRMMTTAEFNAAKRERQAADG
jgi:hypothetical protein